MYCPDCGEYPCVCKDEHPDSYYSDPPGEHEFHDDGIRNYSDYDDIIKCNKFGQGWYRFNGRDHFEFNPYVMENQATIPDDVAKRMPIGSMSMHIGNIVQAEILEYRWSDICDCYMAQSKSLKRFFSKNYGSKLDAFKAASLWIVHEGTLKDTHRQMDLFSEFS